MKGKRGFASFLPHRKPFSSPAPVRKEGELSSKRVPSLLAGNLTLQRLLARGEFPGGTKLGGMFDSQEREARGRAADLLEEAESLPGRVLHPERSGIRLHTDGRAARLSAALGARAFTLGREIYFGAGEYRPHTREGRRLLAHEMGHALSPAEESSTIRRQPIPLELQQSLDVRQLSREELLDHYFLLLETLLGQDTCTPETEPLFRQQQEIETEIFRREALERGSTFTPEAVERMRTYFRRNATSGSPDSCIDTMNQGVRLLLDDAAQSVRGEVQTTMEQLQRAGRAGAAHEIEFLDSRGRVTRGTRRPATLSASVWDALFELSGDDVGWSVFGLSLMDGHHSVTLSLDNNDPENPRVYWSDQWSSKGGWMEFDHVTLDAEITRLIQSWWDGQPVGGKHRTRVTLWRLNP